MAMLNEVQMCATCLVTDVKMFDLSKPIEYALLGTRSRTTLSNALSRMIGVHSNEQRNRFLCFQCGALLKKFDEFRYKCHQAQLFIRYHEQPVQDSNKKTRSFKGGKGFMECRARLMKSHLKSVHNIAVTIIPSSNSVISEMLASDGTETETDKGEIGINCDMNMDDEQFPFESDLEESELPAYNEASEKYITRKMEKKVKSSKRNTRGSLKIDDPDQFPFESDLEESGLPSYNEASEKYIAKKMERKVKGTKRNKTGSLRIDDSDNEPLRKISKKSNEAKLLKKKGPKFDESCFENFTTVTLLTHEDAKKEVELRKETSNYKNSSFKCDLCYRGFEAEKAYDNHMKKHSSDFGNKKCEYCHLMFGSTRDINKHKFSSHRRKFSCQICSYVCFGRSQALVHMNLHKGYKYTCEQCGETYRMPNSLLMHRRLKHPTECVCALCGSTFSTPLGLNRHNLVVHRQETNQQNGPYCEQCDLHFSSEKAWKRHLVLSSKHEVSHGCGTCGETFPDGGALKAHSRTHARKQRTNLDVKLPGACPLCEKWLEHPADYKKHTASEHPESEAAKRIQAERNLPCVCEMCGKRFKKICFLVHHQRQHTREQSHTRERAHTSERSYMCITCGARFASRAALHSHRGTHNPVSLTCDLCRTVFRTTSGLRRHVKVRHLNLRPHKCSICGKSFGNKCDMKYHIQYVHCKVPWPKRNRSKTKQVL